MFGILLVPDVIVLWQGHRGLELLRSFGELFGTKRVFGILLVPDVIVLTLR